MAEVKPLYSSVGAFEAQVFPMNRAADVYFRQKQFESQRNKFLENQLDEQMANTYSDKAQGRQQDIEGLENEYNGLQEYYLKNKASILKGGSAALEFQKKRSAFLFNVQTSKSLKERERNLLPYMKTVAGKTELDADQINAINAFNASIYDPQRKEFKFKDGRDVDAITQVDITPSQTFNKVDMDKTIASNVKDYKFGFETTQGDKKIREEFTMQDPVKIMMGTSSYLGQYPKADKFYQEQFKTLTPEAITQASLEMTEFAKVFTQNKANPIEWDTNGDGKISNHVEYAVYDQIKRNLPENLGSKFDFSPAKLALQKDANARQWQQFQYRKQKDFQALEEKTSNRPIDQAIADDILSGKPVDWKTYSKALNSVYSRQQEGLGNITPAQVQYLSNQELKEKLKDPEFVKRYITPDATFNPANYKDGAMIFQSQTRVYDADGVPLVVSKQNDIAPALAQGIPASQIFARKLPDGRYELYRKKVKIVNTDKTRSPQEVRFDVKSGYSLLSEAVADDPVLRQVDAQLTKRQAGFVASPTEDVPVGGGGSNKPKSSKTTKSSSSSSKQ